MVLRYYYCVVQYYDGSAANEPRRSDKGGGGGRIDKTTCTIFTVSVARVRVCTRRSSDDAAPRRRGGGWSDRKWEWLCSPPRRSTCSDPSTAGPAVGNATDLPLFVVRYGRRRTERRRPVTTYPRSVYRLLANPTGEKKTPTSKMFRIIVYSV